MRFLCLAYGNQAKFEAQTAEELETLLAGCKSRDEALGKTGQVVLQEGLDWAAKSLRPRGGKTVTTDGPYTEAREVVGGVFIVEAKDLDDALRVASKHPAATLGENLGWGIEVRPMGCSPCKEADAARGSP